MERTDLKMTLTQWRQHLHAHPETAFEEHKTSAFIAEKLQEMGIEVFAGMGGTGVIGKLKAGSGTKVIALRADMDAINITEVSGVNYASNNEGKMHACGHDGHVTTLLGAAKLLSENPEFDGTAIFLFQPAEEPGKGAKAMLDDGLLQRFSIDEIYGMHNTPAYDQGIVCTRKGGYCSSEDNFKIEIHGRGAHASAPEMGIDPLVIGAQIILALQTIVSRNVPAIEKVVLSCTEMFTDGAHNAIPGNVTILGDCRSYSPKMQALIERRMHDIVGGICKANGASYEFLYTHEFAPTINSDEQADVVVMAASKVVGAEHVDGNSPVFMGSEDFGAFLEEIPGAFFFLGGGKRECVQNYSLHNPHYDYNDDILEVGAKIFAQIIYDRLPVYCKS